MQGRNRFSADEAAEIKHLLREKVRADRAAQKRIRGRIRAIGFYITDFQTNRSGFTEADFERLVQRNVVMITGDVIGQGALPRIRSGSPRSDVVEPRGQISDGAPDEAEARRLRAAAAAKYRPASVRVLLVAEAPPTELRRYFYFEDVREHDSLFRHVVRGVLEEKPTRANKAELLGRLKERGVFLIDLMEDPKVREDHSAHVNGLIRRCSELLPQAIILIKVAIYDAAYRRLKSADLPVVDLRVPFPGSGQQRNFEEAFAVALREAKRLAR